MDRLLGHLREAAGVAPAEVEDVYPLSPLQSGMVFNALYDADPEDYYEQIGFVLRGRLDTDAFTRAWQQVARRHAVLRSLYVWDGLPGAGAGRAAEPAGAVRPRSTGPAGTPPRCRRACGS